MSNFLKDTKAIDGKINIEMKEVPGEMLEAAFLPYYVDPDSLALTVVLKRSLMAGGYRRTGRKMGLSVLTTELPEDKPITIEEAYATLNIDAKIQQPIPFGSVMPDPVNSSKAYEMVIAQIEPPEMIDEERGILYQEKGKYEIGAIAFDELLGAIQENFIQDLITRTMLSELYIMAVEEANKQQDPHNMMVGNENVIGGGSNLPEGFGDQTDTVRTGDIPDEIIEQNSQMDFGAIYAKASSNSDFTDISNK